MPNGWYPVPGLDVLLINRSEQRSPRYVWGASRSQLWAAGMSGARGYIPEGDVRVGKGSFPEVVRGVQALMEPQLHHGSALSVDFKARRGAACGRFVVYGFREGGVDVLHDHSLIGRLMAEDSMSLEQARALPDHLRKVETSMVRDKGLEIAEIRTKEQREAAGEVVDEAADEAACRDPSRCEFSFEGYEQLVLCTSNVHWDPHWPPASLLDVPAVVLADGARQDVLLALWKRPEERR